MNHWFTFSQRSFYALMGSANESPRRMKSAAGIREILTLRYYLRRSFELGGLARGVESCPGRPKDRSAQADGVKTADVAWPLARPALAA